MPVRLTSLSSGWLEKLSIARSPLQWSRGLRGGLAVGASIVGSHLLGHREGWVALGSFYVVLADNGGPYRSRLKTLATLLIGGALSIACAAYASGNLLREILVTVLVCFAYTFARVLSQHIASTSILTLVIYFAMLSPYAEGADALRSILTLFVCGWLWGACLSLILWPLDPFRPARQAVAQCYKTLEAFAQAVADNVPQNGVSKKLVLRSEFVGYQRQMRIDIESARRALEQTSARAPVRTLRARNLSVLLEVADMLFAATIRAEELDELIPHGERGHFVRWVNQMARWYAIVAANLVTRPPDGGLSFGPNGSYRIDLNRTVIEISRNETSPTLQHLAAEATEAHETIGLAFEALFSIWSGLEQPLSESLRPRLESVTAASYSSWDTIRSNWTLRSIAMQHALRVAIVGAADAIVMRMLHVNHGFWLAMTSLIVLQPNVGHTLQRSLQRVRGTLAGGILAALLAVSLQWPPLLIVVITLLAILTCAFYALDYTWYCFFLTPTFVLMSLPRVHDWQFAVLRVGLTLLGVSISLAAMRILWPETERLNLAGLFARCCAADAAYARSIVELWPLRGTAEEHAGRQKVAMCRRACGLASNDAEECVERVLLEPETLSRRGIPNRASGDGKNQTQGREERWHYELTFVTYVRRLTQSLLGVARLAHGEADIVARLNRMIDRLETLSRCLSLGVECPLPELPSPSLPLADDLAHRQVRRLERQIAILERAATSVHLRQRTPVNAQTV